MAGRSRPPAPQAGAPSSAWSFRRRQPTSRAEERLDPSKPEATYTSVCRPLFLLDNRPAAWADLAFPLPFGSTSAAEGDSGTTPFFFTISSNIAPTTDLNIGYATEDGTATAADNDYVPKSGTATIAAGTKSVTISVDVNGDTTTEPNETFSVVVTNAGGAVITNGTGTGTIVNDDVTITPIHDIQGNGDASPLVGQTVYTRGIVTGRKSNGFFLQAPDAEADADPATSEGIYVFTSSAPPAEAAVGNLVMVQATVSEYSPSQDPLQPPLTELGFATVTQLSMGNPLPAAVPLTTSFPDPEGAYDQLERVEGMRVSAASLTVVGPTDGSTNEPNATGTSNGVFYATVTGDPRPFRTPGIQAPDPAPSGSIPPIPRWDTAPETIEVDSDALGGAKLDLAAGAVVTGVTGPLDYGFRRYTVLPEATPTVADAGETVTAARLPSDDEFTVASYNLERFFDTVNDPAIGEPVLTATAFANRLNKASLGIRDELHTPDVLGVMEMENLSTLQQLADKINADAVAAGDADPHYVAYLDEGNDVGGIDVGFLVKTAPVDGSTPRVEVVDVTQYGKDTTWIDPSTNSADLLNDRPPLLLRAIVHYADGRAFPVSVFAVHQRSLNGISDESASGATTAGDRVRRKRQAQAEYLAGLIQDRQATDPGEHLVVVGDFNAFDFNDGYVDPMGVVTGLPTPAAACLMLLPLVISFQWGPSDGAAAAALRQPVVVGVMIAITSVLMVSKLPTPSIKYMRLQRQHRVLAVAFFAGLAGALIAWPWATLTLGLLIYVGSIPLAIFSSHPKHASKPAV